MNISKRLATGWSDKQANKNKYNCDECSAALWVAPDGKTLYCNAVHEA